MVNPEQNQILTSTGELGLKERSHNRLYWNWRLGKVANFALLERAFKRLIYQGEIMGKTRVVLRAPIESKVMKEVLQSRLKSYLEVAFPIPEEIHQNEVWLLFLGKNQPSRQSGNNTEEIISATSTYGNQPISISHRLKSAVEKGFTIQDRIWPGQTEKILGLWGETFGWTEEEVINLSQRLEKERNLPPSARNVWFSALRKGEEILSVAMAERLTFPLAPGDNIELVESTEWRTQESWQGLGLTTAVTAHLNCQILHDLDHCGGIHPLIFAETNFNSRSDRAAHGAGMIIPERGVGKSEPLIIPQILMQNVEVADGRGPKGLRDFTFVYLPSEAVNNLYSEKEICQALELTNQEAVR